MSLRSLPLTGPAADPAQSRDAFAFYGRPVAEVLAEWSELAPRGQAESVLRSFYRWPESERPWERARTPSLARGLRQALEELGEGSNLPPIVRQSQSECGTEKLLLDLALPGQTPVEVETVLIPNTRRAVSRRGMQERLHPNARRDLGRRPQRASGCVSTQVGCAVGCTFCASGLEGLAKNLSAGQIVAQFLWLRQRAQASGFLLGNLVLMGMGEPFHNLSAVQTACRNLASSCGGELGENHLTLSTIGVPRGIETLQREGPHVNLALSLHSASDALRRELVPLAKKLPPVRELCEQVAAYAQATRRQVTLSYVLLGGVNDSLAQARDLARLASETGLGHVNLIPYNAVEELAYTAPEPDAVYAFYEVLRSAGLPVHVRSTRGADSAAACGQLRRQA